MLGQLSLPAGGLHQSFPTYPLRRSPCFWGNSCSGSEYGFASSRPLSGTRLGTPQRRISPAICPRVKPEICPFRGGARRIVRFENPRCRGSALLEEEQTMDANSSRSLWLALFALSLCVSNVGRLAADEPQDQPTVAVPVAGDDAKSEGGAAADSSAGDETPRCRILPRARKRTPRRAQAERPIPQPNPNSHRLKRRPSCPPKRGMMPTPTTTIVRHQRLWMLRSTTIPHCGRPKAG